MAIPRIFFVIPPLLVGMYLPAVGLHTTNPPAGLLAMRHEQFASKEVTVPCGKTLTMQNDSHWVHIIGPGKNGLVVADKAVPMTRALTETNDVYQTGVWKTAGVYYLTCSVHPEMTVKVVVTGCCC